MRFARDRQDGQEVLGLGQDGFDNPMHQQIGVAPDWAGEMGVSLKRQPKVTTVDWRVNGLLHGAQQHGLNLLCVRPVFGGLGNGLKFSR